LNFAALPESLVESELFGYEQGAFSGAQKGGKQGLFEAAHQGTIFLDEIGDASLAVQKKLLRVLEEREVRRVGGSTVTPIDVRVIAATNIDLKSRVESKNFRIDLFYRLNALPIALPPLREMGTDVHLLAEWFARKFYRHSLRLSGPLKDFLLDYPWPGNIRELQNVVRYLCNVMAPREVATRRHLPPYLAKSAPGTSVVKPPAGPVAAKNFATVTSGLAQRHLQTPVALILREMQQTSALNSGIGRQRLLQRVRETDATMSEHRVRTCMTILERLEFITSGMTRQGSRITREGEAFLSFLESGTRPPAPSRPDANDPGLAADRSGAY
jgi:transcriptional regulator with PAS, ATPase and Fis domain